MADPPGSDRDLATGTPRWVKVAAIVTLVVVILVVVLLLTGRGGPHSPRRHMGPADTTPGHTGPPPGVTHAQP